MIHRAGLVLLGRRKQDLMECAVVACEVHDEGAPDLGRDASVCEQFHHVEEVARVLTIHRSHELATVDLFGREQR